jgi:micrococcal nuclease
VEEIVRLGQAAREFAESLAPAGTTLYLERDVQPTDRYGRTLAYLWTTDGRLVQEEILRAGWADLLTIPPNVRHTERLRSAWREARESRRGIWR